MIWPNVLVFFSKVAAVPLMPEDPPVKPSAPDVAADPNALEMAVQIPKESDGKQETEK